MYQLITMSQQQASAREFSGRERLIDLAAKVLDASSAIRETESRKIGDVVLPDATELTAIQLMDIHGRVSGAVLRRIQHLGQLVSMKVFSISGRVDGPILVVEGTYLESDFRSAMDRERDYSHLVASLTPRQATSDDIGEFLDSTMQSASDSPL